MEGINHVLFIHLDLGIGGAEQLILNLALASHREKKKVTILTSHCDPNHCFDLVKRNGELSDCVHVYGSFIPPSIFGSGYGKALCSTIRMLYLGLIAVLLYRKCVDIFVLDVLPTPIPFLKWFCSEVGILFYCHFPDKLLIRKDNGVTCSRSILFFKSLYRHVFDWIEEYSICHADLLVVNSSFTECQVRISFPRLIQKDIKILYPCVDMTKFTPPTYKNNFNGPIISLNRYERKKNIEILIHAYAALLEKKTKNVPLLIIAGGYDRLNQENVEYLKELQKLAYETLQLPKNKVDFQCSISDIQKKELFETASCLVYTPFYEHFGIVPIEAMYAGIPVIAMRSGGPCETIKNYTTGILVNMFENNQDTILDDSTIQQNLVKALKDVLFVLDRSKMSMEAHLHVKKKFSFQKFSLEWNGLLETCRHETACNSKKCI